MNGRFFQFWLSSMDCCLRCSVDAVSNQTLFSFFFFLNLDGACGADAEVRAWMDRVAHSAVADEEPAKAEVKTETSSSNRAKSSSSAGDDHSSSTSTPSFFHSEVKHNRSRRAANYYHNYRIPNYEAAGRISYRYCSWAVAFLLAQHCSFSSFWLAIRHHTSSSSSILLCSKWLYWNLRLLTPLQASSLC